MTAADEADDQPTAPRPPDNPPAPLPSPAEVNALFAELQVEPGKDGSLHLHASPRAAQTLGALFANLATLLEGEVRSTRTSARSSPSGS